MKRNRAAIAYCCLLIGGLLYKVLSGPHAFVKEGYWRATLSTANGQLPFNLEVRGTSAENAKVFLLTGDQRREVTPFSQHQDTLLLTLSPYQVLIKAHIKGQFLVGTAFPLHKQDLPEGILFRAEHGSKHPAVDLALEAITGKNAFASLTAQR